MTVGAVPLPIRFHTSRWASKVEVPQVKLQPGLASQGPRVSGSTSSTVRGQKNYTVAYRSGAPPKTYTVLYRSGAPGNPIPSYRSGAPPVSFSKTRGLPWLRYRNFHTVPAHPPNPIPFHAVPAQAKNPIPLKAIPIFRGHCPGYQIPSAEAARYQARSS